MYVLEYLRGESIVGQYYTEELMPVKITWRTDYQIDKILDHAPDAAFANIPSGEMIGPVFDSWITMSNIKRLRRWHFYVTLLNDGSRGMYPDNTVSNFKTRLVKPVDLTTGAWEVDVFEFPYTSPASGTELHPIFLYWDLIGPQLVGDMFRRCLRIVHYTSPKDHRVSYNVDYLPVEKADCQSIAIDELTKLGDRDPFPDILKSLVAVLHFRRRQYRV